MDEYEVCLGKVQSEERWTASAEDSCEHGYTTFDRVWDSSNWGRSLCGQRYCPDCQQNVG
jgi:hypothetical protein